MSPTGNKIPTESSSPANPSLSRSYKEASSSRWQLEALFQTFLEDRPADTVLAVQERRLLISWDLKAIHYLRKCLRTWILDKVPGDAIGAFLVTVLYEQDFHLDYRLTMMVRDGETQLHIARRLLAFYQIRDEEGDPLWDNVTIYAEDAHPKPSVGQGNGAAGRPAATKGLPRIPTSPPADPRWPFFIGALSDPEVEDLMDKLGDDDQHAEEYLPPLFTGVSKEDIPIIQAFRSFNFHKNDYSEDIPLSEPGSDQIEHISKQTDTSQDKPLPPASAHSPLTSALPLPLPPLSCPSSPNPSFVRVSTFKAEKKIKTKDTTGLLSSSRARPKPPVNVDDNQHPPRPSDTVHVFIRSPWHYNIPPSPPQLKKKAGVEDLRKARERGA
ncbi:hypothetical protein CBS147326_9777 [Penicillium roqueforti]|nr:hypothetical protein CBS147326_9777 [Penicillium roqueforti]